MNKLSNQSQKVAEIFRKNTMNTPTNKCNCYCHKEGTFQEEDGVSSTHAPSDCQCHLSIKTMIKALNPPITSNNE